MSNLDSKYIINLDLMQDTKNNTMHFNLSDSETSDFWINITRYGVDINEELLDKTVTLYVVKPNKNVEFGNISYDSTEKMYYCNLSSEFKNIKGNYTAQVVIYDSSTKERKVTRSKFKYYVEDDILSDASGTVKPEEQENILDDIISRLAALEEGGDGTNATASNITIADTANNFTATNVEGALAELADDMKNVGSPTDEQVASVINEAIANGDIVAGGLTSTAQTLLISILRNAVFTSDQSESITLLQSELAKGNGGGGSTETTQYTVNNNLSNATTNNNTVLVDANASYSATITVNDGYELSSITVTMGGTDITSTVVSGATITISAVTGNVVITVSTIATSTEPVALYQLPEEATFDGTKYIDTGTSVYGLSSYSIVLDFTATSSGSGHIMSCYADVSNFINLHFNYSADLRFDGKVGDTWLTTVKPWTSNDTSLTDIRRKIVVTHNSGQQSWVHFISHDGVEKSSDWKSNLFNDINSNIILGCNAEDMGTTTNNNFKGAIHDFKVYNEVISDAKITEYLGGGTNATI